jgi:hypothetical protein
MSMSKGKYFEVTTVSSVMAINKGEAEKAATSRGRIPNTKVLARTSVVERRYAAEAQALAAELTN